MGSMQEEAKLNMHKMFLEALRHREQDIVRFLAILGPALGGFIWLLGAGTRAQFIGGTYGVLLTLVLGAFYALALGYNYRYLTLQLAKLESEGHIGLNGTVLTSWPRTPEQFIERGRWGVIPWCTPPGIIKVFWVAFLACILGVTVVASVVLLDPGKVNQASPTQPRSEEGSGSADVQDTQTLSRLKNAIPFTGTGAFLAAWLLGPFSVGRKMLRACREEELDDWKKSASDEQTAPEGEGHGGNDGTRSES